MQAVSLATQRAVKIFHRYCAFAQRVLFHHWEVDELVHLVVKSADRPDLENFAFQVGQDKVVVRGNFDFAAGPLRCVLDAGASKTSVRIIHRDIRNPDL